MTEADPPTYGRAIGFVYVFNLIVGAGAITIPHAFSAAGLLAGILMLLILGFVSFVCVTYVVECMSITNAVLKIGERDAHRAIPETVPLVDPAEDSDDDVKTAPRAVRVKTEFSDVAPRAWRSPKSTENLRDGDLENWTSPYDVLSIDAAQDSHPVEEVFSITERAEMGMMAKLYYGPWGLKLFYVCLVAYLYGDLAIYAVAVPKAVAEVACGGAESDFEETYKCFGDLTWGEVYALFLGIFSLIVVPFCFFDVQKTKMLQLFTTVMRYLCFALMIGITVTDIGRGHGDGHPKAVELDRVPILFGVCIYAFMCHHSLPSLITPIRDKRGLYGLLAADFCLIFGFYVILCLFAVLDFPQDKIEDIYTENFKDFSFRPVAYFLGLYPAFTLSTNFPIICITLTNNVRMLFQGTSCLTSRFVDRVVFPFLAAVPPILLAFCTRDVELLVSITGSYAGLGIQWIVPATLVYCARKRINNTLRGRVQNKHQSPFASVAFVYGILSLSVVALGVITYNHVK